MTVADPEPPKPQSQQGGNLITTTAVAYGTSGGAAVLIWFFQCLKAHTIIVPDEGTALFMAGMFAPTVHAIHNAFVAWINRKTGVT